MKQNQNNYKGKRVRKNPSKSPYTRKGKETPRGDRGRKRSG